MCDRLIRAGEEVVGLDNFDPFYARDVKVANLTSLRDAAAFRLVEADVRDPDALRGLPGSIETVIHLAARAGVRPSIAEPALYHDVNVLGTVRLLEWVRERGIERFVFGSSSSVYGNNEKVPFSEDDPVDHPISPYAATKRSAELACHAYRHLFGISTVCLRFFTVYGPRQRPDLAIHKFARLMRRGEPVPMFGDGASQRDYTYIDDILAGIDGALSFLDANPGVFEIVNLGESRTVSLREMIRCLASALCVDPEIRFLPPQPGDVDRTFADVSKARGLFGYEPSTPFEEGVARFVRWLGPN